jgi:hypothetical protein
MGPSDSDREREEGATYRKIHRYLKGLSHEINTGKIIALHG